MTPELDDEGRIYFWAECGEDAVIHYCLYAHPEDGMLIARDLHLEHSEEPEELWPYPADVFVYLELDHYRVDYNGDADVAVCLSDILALFGRTPTYAKTDACPDT